MTRQQKLVLIGLVLIGLVFALVMLRGGLQKGDCPDTKKCSDDYIADLEDKKSRGEQGGLSATVGGWLISLAPKVAWTNKPESWREKPRFLLSGGVPIEEQVEPDKEKPFRILRMRLTSGTKASLEYIDTDSRTKAPKLHQQPLTLSASDKPEGTFVVTRKGGRLTIGCVGLGPCAVEVR